MSVNRIQPAHVYYHIALTREVVMGDAAELQAAIERETDAAIAAGPLLVHPELGPAGHRKLNVIANLNQIMVDSPDLRAVLVEMFSNRIFEERDKVIHTSVEGN